MSRSSVQDLLDTFGRGTGGKSNGRDMVRRANLIPIFDVLEDFFGIIHPRDGESYKGYCPWAFEHADGGLDKGFRTYPATNSAYCFVMHGVLNPVRLIQVREDVRPYAAARKLMEHYGLSTGQHYRERFETLVRERETRRDDLGNPAYLVEALHLTLSGEPTYAARQFDPDVAGTLEEQLARLDALMARPGTTEVDVRDWYQSARDTVTALLEKTDAHT